MEVQLSYSKSWKTMLWKCCTQYAHKFGKLSSGHRTGKGQFSLQSQRKYAKECPYYHTIALTSHTSKLMLKILQARLQQCVNWELPDVQSGFRKAEDQRSNNIRWIIKKAREFQKNIYFCSIDYAKAFDCVDHNKLWKILWGKKRWEYQTTWPASWEICMQVRKQQLELDMEQQTGSK